jgi:hypothetical protein
MAPPCSTSLWHLLIASLCGTASIASLCGFFPGNGGRSLLIQTCGFHGTSMYSFQTPTSLWRTLFHLFYATPCTNPTAAPYGILCLFPMALPMTLTYDTFLKQLLLQSPRVLSSGIIFVRIHVSPLRQVLWLLSIALPCGISQ